MPTTEVYPRFNNGDPLWLSVGEILSVCGVHYTGAGFGSPSFAATFSTFQSDNNAIAEIFDLRWNVTDDMSQAATSPVNLKGLIGKAAGTCEIDVVSNSTAATPLSVIVDDPAATPNAVIEEGNQTVKTGEVVLLSFKNSSGIGYKAGGAGEYDTKHNIKCDWGDGDHTKGLRHAVHAYQVPGAYTVTLTVTNNSGATDTAHITVTVEDFAAYTATHNVANESQFLTAWAACTGGELINVTADISSMIHVPAPATPFTTWVTIKGSGFTPPSRTTRVDPSDAGLRTFTNNTTNAPNVPLSFEASANMKYVRLLGLKFGSVAGTGPASGYGLAIGADGDVELPTSLSDQPSYFIIDHCAMNPPDNTHIVHAFHLNGWKISVNNCYIGNARANFADSQAVWTSDGRGAFSFTNCYLEATGENVMFGGSGTNFRGIVTEDVEFRRCHFKKADAWVGDSTPLFKNLFENKNGRRMYFEGCIFENHWDGHVGQLRAINFSNSPSPGDGSFCPWADTSDLHFENCKIHKVFGWMVFGMNEYDVGNWKGLRNSRVTFENCHIFDVSENYTASPPAGNISLGILAVDILGLCVKHCNLITLDASTGFSIWMYSRHNYNFVIRDNLGTLHHSIAGANTGFNGWTNLNLGSGGTTGSGSAKDADAKFFFAGNVLTVNFAPDATGLPNTSPNVNQYPANTAAVGFTNIGTEDFSLSAGSAYKNDALDGTDPGCRWAELQDRIASTESGTGWEYEEGSGGSPAVQQLFFGGLCLTFGGQPLIKQ